MPLALVSDIHGNDHAFARVVAELELLGVERAVCLGDAVQGGDEPREVLDRLAARAYDDVLLPGTPDAEAVRRWGGSGAAVLAGGHTHLQWTRIVDGALYVNPGSVGVSDDGLAQFAVVTGASVSFKRVAWNES